MRSPFISFLFLFLPIVLISQDNSMGEPEQRLDSLIQLNRQLIGKRNINDAWQVISDAKTLSDSLLDPMSPRVGLCLFNYGRTLHMMEDYRQAEEYYLLALENQRKHKDTHSVDLANTLNALAYLYSLLARYEDAEALYYEALKIRKTNLGESHEDYATSVNNLGTLFLAKGNLSEAERYFVEALALRKKILGEDHLDYATSLNNLGVLYKKMGKFKDAEQLYMKAKDIRVEQMGPKHFLVGVSLNNLANLYLQMEQYQKAEAMYLQTLEIWKEALGIEHGNVATTDNNLAQLYQKTGRYQEAEALFREATTIWSKKLGGDHPQVAMGRNNLGLLFMEAGDYSSALQEMEAAREVRKRLLGQEHPDFGNSQNGLGQLYWHMHVYEKAKSPLLDAALLQQRLLEEAVKHLTEQEQVEYAERFLENLDLFYSYAHDFASTDPDLAGACTDLALFHKGFVLEASQIMRNQIRSNPAVKTRFNELLLLRQKLAKEYSKPISERIETEQLEKNANALEKEIGFALGDNNRTENDVTWTSVKEKLKSGEGALEFIHFHYRHPDLTDSVFYAALVVRSDRSQPVFISLFERSAIDEVLNPEGARRSDYVNGLYAYADRGLVDQAELAPSLYDLIWKPLEEHPDGVHDLKTIYYSLTGLLHRLNLGAIAIDDEHSLADQYQLVQLGSTRKLAQQKQADHTVNNGVLFGGIRYDLDSVEVLAALALDDPSLLASRGDQTMANIDQSIKSGAWSYLKWTERESKTIATILEGEGMSIQQFSDIEGTEEAFKALGSGIKSSPGIIHMATHGYFFPDPEEIHQENSSEVVFQLSANPMIRSGLILAGGNYVWSGAKPFTGMEDGILTAYEISQMDLSNTELVVLSACETGLGDIKGNEGVYGLQRAFKIAGVKNLIMSLWQVPDRETMQFMTTFYGHWLADKRMIPEAFQLTQQEMRDRFYNPYSWAGFVLVE